MAEDALTRLRHILTYGNNLNSDEWCLVASLVVKAAKNLPPNDPELVKALDELSDATEGFTLPEFVTATRAPRRQRYDLFKPRH